MTSKELSPWIAASALIILVFSSALYLFLQAAPTSPYNSYFIQELIQAYGTQENDPANYIFYYRVLPFIFSVWKEESFIVASWLITLLRAISASLVFLAVLKLGLSRLVAVAVSLCWILFTTKSLAVGNFGISIISELLLSILLLCFSIIANESTSKRGNLLATLLIIISFALLLSGSIFAIVWLPLVLMHLTISLRCYGRNYSIFASAVALFIVGCLSLRAPGLFHLFLSYFSHSAGESIFLSALKFIFVLMPLPLIITSFYPLLALRVGMAKVVAVGLTLIIHLLLLTLLVEKQVDLSALGNKQSLIQSLNFFILYSLVSWFKESRLDQFFAARIFLAISVLMPGVLAIISLDAAETLKETSHLAKVESQIIVKSLPERSIFVATNGRIAASLQYEQAVLGKRSDLSIMRNLTSDITSKPHLYSNLDLKLPSSHVLYSAGIVWQVVEQAAVVTKKEIASNFLSICPLLKVHIPNVASPVVAQDITDVFKAPLVNIFGSSFSTAELDLIKHLMTEVDVEGRRLQELCVNLAQSYGINELPELPMVSYQKSGLY